MDNFEKSKNISEIESVELFEEQTKTEEKKVGTEEERGGVPPMENKKKKPEMKECIYCGHMIAASAKICPNCGGKNKKPIYRRIWFIILLMLLGSALFSEWSHWIIWCIGIIVASIGMNWIEKGKRSSFKHDDSKIKVKICENKKKLIIVASIIGILLVGSIYIIGQSNQYEYAGTSTVSEVVPVVLYKHLSDPSLSNASRNKLYTYDIGSTKFDIGTTKRQSDGTYDVKGTFTLYNQYGEMSSIYYKERFEMNVSLDGGLSYCATTFGFGYY